MQEPLVSVRNLGKVYEPTPGWMRILVRSSTREPVVALDNVSFDVRPGQICAIIGPNGAGKSTLFRALTGLTTPDSGSCRIVGMDPVTEAHRIRRYVGFMPSEDRTLFLRHTSQENLHFHGRLQGLEESTLRSRIDEVLETVGLSKARDRVGFALSSGMRARLMLARAILHEPKVLILDEPTGAIDPVGAFDLLQTIQNISAEHGLATLISSHRVEEIDALRDNVMLLDQGRVVYWGDLQQVRNLWDRPRFEITFSARDAREAALAVLSAVNGNQLQRIGDLGLSLLTDEEAGPLLSRLHQELASIRSVSQSRMPLADLLRMVLAGSDDDRGGAK